MGLQNIAYVAQLLLQACFTLIKASIAKAEQGVIKHSEAWVHTVKPREVWSSSIVRYGNFKYSHGKTANVRYKFEVVNFYKGG